MLRWSTGAPEEKPGRRGEARRLSQPPAARAGSRHAGAGGRKWAEVGCPPNICLTSGRHPPSCPRPLARPSDRQRLLGSGRRGPSRQRRRGRAPPTEPQLETCKTGCRAEEAEEREGRDGGLWRLACPASTPSGAGLSARCAPQRAQLPCLPSTHFATLSSPSSPSGSRYSSPSALAVKHMAWHRALLNCRARLTQYQGASDAEGSLPSVRRTNKRVSGCIRLASR